MMQFNEFIRIAGNPPRADKSAVIGINLNHDLNHEERQEVG